VSEAEKAASDPPAVAFTITNDLESYEQPFLFLMFLTE
jgi:hypothetical protein